MTGTRVHQAVTGRLEELRDGHGLSLRGFHQAVETRTGLSFSYTAARNYHDLDPVKGRAAPMKYLDAVSLAFDVGLVWLVRGEGHMKEKEGRDAVRERARMDGIASNHPVFRTWPLEAQVAFIGLQRLQLGADPQLPEIDEDLLWLVMLPLEAWGFRSLEELNSRDRTAYFQSMFAALSIAARSGIGGNRLSEYPDSVLPRLRRLRDGKDAGPSGEERSHFEDRERIMDEVIIGPPSPA